MAEKNKNININSDFFPQKYADAIVGFPADEQKAIKKKYESMKYEVGEAIGVVAAQSISEPATQTTLRSYHAEGRTQLVTTKGLPRLIEIFDARKVPKTPTMAIYLDEQNNTLEKAREIASKIRETKLKQLISEDSLDMIHMRVEIILDREQVNSSETNVEEIANILKKNLRSINITTEQNKIYIELKKKEFDIRELQAIRIKTRTIYIKGIKGVSQVIIEKVKNDWVIRTLGSSLRRVLKLKGVDTTRTTSNNIFEISEVLGIEAARNAIVKETIDTMREQGVDTDIRHLLLVADVMTNNSAISAIGRYGLAGRKASVLSRANFEETVKHLTYAAVAGEIDPLESVIENIIVGNLAPIGTGIVKLAVKEE